LEDEEAYDVLQVLQDLALVELFHCTLTELDDQPKERCIQLLVAYDVRNQHMSKK